MSLPPNIVRLTAPNPGPFTGTGTNTYLVGERALAVIDPGPDSASHLAAILEAANGRPITHILLTHAHRDHVDGLAPLQQATGAITVGFKRDGKPAPAAATSPSGGDFVAWDFVPAVNLADGAHVAAGDKAFEAVHTPGHAPDHLCFALIGPAPVLFSGDHVMGWSTSVIAPPEGHMGDYIASLQRLLPRPQTLYLPGHGDALDDGPRLVRAYLLHRQMREQAVLDAIRSGERTIDAITDRVYAGLAPRLRNAARLSVQAHIDLLREKAVLTAASAADLTTQAS
jgi:glyoxylase-like metal-dependent hydrolase (beta-lactamase superfamily II)